MLYFTGDTHGDFSKFSAKRYGKFLTEHDVVIIAGDFGGIWWTEPNKDEEYWIKWLSNKSFTIAFVDGNHENFDRLNQFPVETLWNGQVHRISQNVVHLMRNQIYEIQGYKVFTCGGAESTDIRDGVLDKTFRDAKHIKWATLKKKPKGVYGEYQSWPIYNVTLPRLRSLLYRVHNVSWWEDELPSESILAEIKSRVDNQITHVDFVVTHCAPTRVQVKLTGDTQYINKLTDLFQYLDLSSDRFRYRKWIFGHYHMDRQVDDKHIVIYNNLIRADTILNDECAS